MLLEALEDSLRGSYGEGQPCPRNLTVEHVMPQAWQAYWGADIDGDDIAAARRDELVQSLGNLTLVSAKLNPALSNRPWTDADVAGRGLSGHGKRSYLLDNSQLQLNAAVVARNETEWTEHSILLRSSQLVDRLAAIWPKPTDPGQPDRVLLETERVADDAGQDDDDPAMPTHDGKYRQLWAWLRAQDRDEIQLDFAETEQILGFPLPPSARVRLPPWYGYQGTALGRAIRDAGWKASKVDLTNERVVFFRATPPVDSPAND
jgi:hypothetical protein